MTKDSDFKHLVRERMARTGENHTTARAALLSSPPPATDGPTPSDAARDQQRLVQRWFIDGRLRDIPAKHKVRVAVLLEVLTRLEPGRVYTEREVSAILREVHPDFAYLRRELVEHGYLTRAGGQYRVADHMPERTPLMRAELPAWEAEWLPGFLSGDHS